MAILVDGQVFHCNLLVKLQWNNKKRTLQMKRQEVKEPVDQLTTRNCNSAIEVEANKLLRDIFFFFFDVSMNSFSPPSFYRPRQQLLSPNSISRSTAYYYRFVKTGSRIKFMIQTLLTLGILFYSRIRTANSGSISTKSTK